MRTIKLIECPRDAMQGWPVHIPAKIKAEYINLLLKAGFDTIDFGSFVSPKAIPQMADTREVLEMLEPSPAKLLAIVANNRGATDAAEYDRINYLGFPFSISETFQQRNTNSGIEEALVRVDAIQETCLRSNKELVIYISMAFGNPYGDPYTEELAYYWVSKLVDKGIRIISLADTVGLATPDQVYRMTRYMVDAFPEKEIGVHLHSSPTGWEAKLKAAVDAGCNRFDGALKGIGGCPMANDELVGNMDSEKMIDWFRQRAMLPPMTQPALDKAIQFARQLFFSADEFHA